MKNPLPLSVTRFLARRALWVLYPLRRAVARSLARDEIYIQEGAQRADRIIAVHWLRGLLFIGIIAGLFLVHTFISGWVGGLCGLIAAFGYGAALGLVPGRLPRQATAYRSGWLDGRSKLVKGLLERDPLSLPASLHEAYVFDMVHVLGLPPDVPDDPSGIGGDHA